MTLKGRRELYYLLDQDLGVLGGIGYGKGVGKVQTELLDIFHGLTAAVGSVHHAEVVNMYASAHVRIRHIRGEDLQQSEFLLYVLCKGEVRRLRAVGNVGVLLVGGHYDLPCVVDRSTQASVLLAYVLKPVFHQLGVGELSDQRGGDVLYIHLGDHLLHFPGDDACGLLVNIGFTHECIVYPLLVPLLELFIRRPDE